MKPLLIVLALLSFTTLYAQIPGGVTPTRQPPAQTPPPQLPPNWPPYDPNAAKWPMELFKKREKVEIDRTHTFVVNLKDSSQLIVEGKISLDSDSYCLTWTDDNLKRNDPGRVKKIYPTQTLSLVRRDDSSSAGIEGVVVGSAWLFTAISGKLTVYTTVSEDDLPDESLLYIRKDNGPIQNVTPDTLEQLLQGDEKALTLLHKGKIRKAIELHNARFRTLR